MCKGLLGSAWYFAGTTSDSDSEGGIVMDNTGEVGRDQVIQGHEEEPRLS